MKLRYAWVAGVLVVWLLVSSFLLGWLPPLSLFPFLLWAAAVAWRRRWIGRVRQDVPRLPLRCRDCTRPISDDPPLGQLCPRCWTLRRRDAELRERLRSERSD